MTNLVSLRIECRLDTSWRFPERPRALLEEESMPNLASSWWIPNFPGRLSICIRRPSILISQPPLNHLLDPSGPLPYWQSPFLAPIQHLSLSSLSIWTWGRSCNFISIPFSLPKSRNHRNNAERPYLNISGTIKNRTWLPRIYTWSRWLTRPSRAVTVMSLSCTFMLSSAADDLAVSQVVWQIVRTYGRGNGYPRWACHGRLGQMWFRGLWHGSGMELLACIHRKIGST